MAFIYQKVTKKSEHRAEITHDKLIKLGFEYKMRTYRKDNFSVCFFKYLYKCCYGKSGEFDIVYMDELYNKYWELTGKVLKPLE